MAPTVAYPEAPWTTTWQDTITITAKALGRSEHGAKILADIDKSLADQAKAHPEFQGKTIAALYPAPSSISLYTEPGPAPVDPHQAWASRSRRAWPKPGHVQGRVLLRHESTRRSTPSTPTPSSPTSTTTSRPRRSSRTRRRSRSRPSRTATSPRSSVARRSPPSPRRPL
ncbi:ABC transporter substrate-binding protein [Nocardioides sp. W3-2-3]|nr:ABC transporter substrate-binding protein [Nocardioides convexus]